MEELVIRPTMKFIRIGYLLAGLLLVAAIIVQSQWTDRPEGLPSWLIPAASRRSSLWAAGPRCSCAWARTSNW